MDALRPDRPGRAHESDRNICPLVSPATTSELFKGRGLTPALVMLGAFSSVVDSVSRIVIKFRVGRRVQNDVRQRP